MHDSDRKDEILFDVLNHILKEKHAQTKEVIAIVFDCASEELSD